MGTNIAKKNIRDSAIGGVFRDLPRALSKTGHQQDLAIARIELGTLAPIALVAAMDDRVIGSLDHTNAADAILIDNNVPEYSIRLDDGPDGLPQYLLYGKYEPLRAVIGLIANYKAAWAHYDRVNPETGVPTEGTDLAIDVVELVMGPFIQTITDNYMLENIGGIMTFIEALQGEADNATIYKEFHRLTTSAVFTNLVNNVNSTYFDDNFRYADDALQKIYSRNIGLSQLNESQYNAWGDERLRSRYVGPDYISSVVSPRYSMDEIDLEIGNMEVMLDKPPKNLDIDGVLVPLTGPQKSLFSQIRGKGVPDAFGPIKPKFAEMMSDPDYLAMGPYERKEQLNSLWSEQTRHTRDYMIRYNPEIKALYETRLIQKEIARLKGRANAQPVGQQP